MRPRAGYRRETPHTRHRRAVRLVVWTAVLGLALGATGYLLGEPTVKGLLYSINRSLEELLR